MMRKLTTWRRNFKRWSVQLATIGSALGGLEALGHAAQAAHSTLPLWKPLLPPEMFALVSTALFVGIAVVRNMSQEDVE